MAKKLFGTDGIRAVANDGLTIRVASRLGRAVTHFLSDTASDTPGTFLIVRDTRRSGAMLEAALIAGITASGGNVVVGEILPTPAAALIIKELGLDGGVVISASHNPPEFNGLKVFNREGGKLSDELEAEIERYMDKKPWRKETPIVGAGIGTVTKLDDGEERYINHAVSLFEPRALSGLRVAVDVGHGAAYHTTPRALELLGAEVTVINDDFNGDDINVECGSTNLAPLQELMKTGMFDMGIAHDGDADRFLAVDELGEEVDGDAIIAILALALHEQDALKENTVVATVMSNIGLERMLDEHGIKLIKAQVGDRYVLEQMHASGAVLGGEQSGHIVFLEHNTTGDGLLTALFLADYLMKSNRKLSDLSGLMMKYPQVLKNVPVSDRSVLNNNSKVIAAIKAAEEALGSGGRVLVRASGTEPLIRVMAEAMTTEEASKYVDAIALAIEEADGGAGGQKGGGGGEDATEDADKDSAKDSAKDNKKRAEKDAKRDKKEKKKKEKKDKKKDKKD